MLPISRRQDIAKETLAVSPDIISSTVGASAHSTKYSDLIPPLENPTVKRGTVLKVVNKDAFAVAESLVATTRPEKVAVLNFASNATPGGTFLEGGLGQEEHLSYRSTLAITLRKECYPLAPLTTIWSPNVVVFREDLPRGFLPFLDRSHRFVVGVVSCGGLKDPELRDNGTDYKYVADLGILKAKIRQILRVCAINGRTHLVLGALGCGHLHNPPKRVAQAFKDVLDEEEWNGRFEDITFAVMDTQGEGNFRVFRDVIGRRRHTADVVKGQLKKFTLRGGKTYPGCLARQSTDSVVESDLTDSPQAMTRTMTLKRTESGQLTLQRVESGQLDLKRVPSDKPTLMRTENAQSFQRPPLTKVTSSRGRNFLSDKSRVLQWISSPIKELMSPTWKDTVSPLSKDVVSPLSKYDSPHRRPDSELVLSPL